MSTDFALDAIRAAPPTDIKWALDGIRRNALRAARPRAYFDGEHNLAFAGEKFRSAFGPMFREFAENMMPVVVETTGDRLQIAGFTFPATSSADDLLREIWRRNRMAKRAGEVHQDALIDADAFVVVWPDAEGFPVLYPNRADRMAVRYDDEQPGFITRAAKAWRQEDKYGRVTLYYPDRIEKYVSARPLEDGGLSEDPRRYQPFKVPGEMWPLPNPYGKVPVFHFANRASIGSMGRSELKEALPIQDALNKSVIDMLVAMEFSALPQRWATGLEDGSEGKLRPGGIWAVEDKDTKFGDFTAGDISKFLLVAERFCKQIARVTRTPLHYFTLEGSFPSGESLRVADAPLLAKVRDKQTSWGMVWADVARFCLQIAGAGDTDPETVWTDTAPRNQREQVEIAGLKQSLGVPRDQTLREIGYEAAEVEAFKKEREDAAPVAMKTEEDE